MIAADTVIARAPTALSGDEDGKISIMDIERGSYFDLEEPASTIWHMIETPTEFDAICTRLATEFEADRAMIERDAGAFLDEMREEGLVIFTSLSES